MQGWKVLLAIFSAAQHCHISAPQAVQMEHVAAGQLLVARGWRHVLAADDAHAVAARQVLRACVLNRHMSQCSALMHHIHASAANWLSGKLSSQT